MSGRWSSCLGALLIAILFLLSACGSNGKKREAKNVAGEKLPAAVSRLVSGVKILSPERRATYSLGDEVKLSWSDSYTSPIDSVQVFYDNRLISLIVDSLQQSQFQLSGGVGVRNIKLQVYYSDGKSSVAITPITVLPSPPKHLSYRIVNVYPHDKTFFTQGLYFHEGYLYEGTGEYGSSALLKVDPISGKKLVSKALKDSYFGEGIACLHGKIYQLTWTNGVCLVYDAETMEQIDTYMYASQGWGLTSDGEKLIMSDGSNKLTIIDPNNFSQLRQLQVYDHNGAVEQLNELEFVDGLVWANVWQSDRVVAIDLNSGAVVAELNLAGLLSETERSRLDGIDHVLNGIAFDHSTGYFYFTGKCWPKMFKIEIDRQ